MKITILLALSCLFLLACQSPTAPDEITIEGAVSNVPDGKVYLARADNRQVPLDSAVCTNGHFTFRISTDTAFEPYLATITFPEGRDSTKLSPLLYRNHWMGADSGRYFGNVFYVENGHTRMEGDNSQSPYLRLFAGAQTEIMLKPEKLSFGWLQGLDSPGRLKRLAYFKKYIASQPTSYFLLKKIYDNKEQYSVNELTELIALFGKAVQNSKTAKQFQSYFAKMHTPGQRYPNLFLPTAANEKGYILDSMAKLNMVIFWASWCVPCRKEIPAVKRLYRSYRDKGLHVASISIDENKDGWLKALRAEKMPWAQHLVDPQNIDEVKQRFNFGHIPFVIFTDKTGKEVNQFLGYEEGQEKKYEAVIKAHIINK